MHSIKFSNLQSPVSRSSRGFTLATVLIIGMVATLLVTAMFGAVLPSFQKTIAVRSQTALRNSAEAGLDWAVAQYNLDNGVTSGLDGALATATYSQVAAGMEGPVTNVPADIANRSSLDSFTPTVTVQVKSMQPNGSSPAYDPAVALQPPGAQTNGITKNMWRIITATSVAPGGAHSRSIQVVIKPNPPITSSLAAIKANDFTNNGANFKTYAKTSDPTVAPDPPGGLGGDIDVNHYVDLSGMTVNGAVTCRKQPKANTTSNYIDGDKNTHIYGEAKANGLIEHSKSTIDGSYLDSSNNKLTRTPAYQQSLSMDEFQFPTIPLHPSGSTAQAPITKTSSLGVSGVTTNYYIDAGGSEINMKNKDLTIDGPTRLYLEGDTTTAPGNPPNVVSFSGTSNIINKSGKPQDFVIYYSGKGLIDLSGCSSFTGVIIAPNATCKFDGNAKIYGAVMSNIVTANGGGSSGEFVYDPCLSKVNLLPVQQTYNTITWRELGGN